jgi:hypothetical protein
MSTPLDSDLVILNPTRDNYTSLDDIGRRVWDLIALPVKIEDLCGQMALEYQGNPQQITMDLMVLLNFLAAEGLVEVQTADEDLIHAASA